MTPGIFMRKIEHRILEAFKQGKYVRLSERDEIFDYTTNVAYQLLRTTVASRSKNGSELTLGVYKGYYRTNTTKSRINAFADAYGLPRIYQRDFVWWWSDGLLYTGERTFSLKSEEDYAREPF